MANLSNINDKFIVTDGGNVLIGATTSTARLVVQSGGTDPQILVKNTNASSDAKILLVDNDGGTQNASIIFDQNGENQLYIGTGYNSPSDLNRIYFQPGGEIAMTIRGGSNATGNAGNVGIGTTLPGYKLHVVSSVPEAACFDTTSASYGAMNVFKAQGVIKGNAGYNAGSMYFGGESGTNTIIQSGGQTGIYINNSTRNVGITITNPSQAFVVKDGMVVTGANQTAASTSGDYICALGGNVGAKSLHTKGHILADGGIYLGGSASANLLDFYQQGIWTPTLKFAGNEVGITYGGAPQTVYRAGHYVKIGNVVTFSMRIILTSKGTSVGEALLYGLPYVVASLPGNYGSAMYSFANNFAIPERASITMDSSQSIIRLRFTNSAGAYGNVTNGTFNNNSDIILTGTYISA